ncbi:MAG: cob(I)yrinic acid a,c-diamide adenosyltransferase [Chloroflexi bacterium]|nr:cob(I)yrinic acid a,c-diamide adenosyltransferase [Chloroflexota bacterium]
MRRRAVINGHSAAAPSAPAAENAVGSAPAERRAPHEKKRKGLVMIFTGNGKGKTTAAMGMALRAAGNRMRVMVIQFIKGRWKTGEVEAASALQPYFQIVRAGRGFTVEGRRDDRVDLSEHQVAAREGLEQARTYLTSGQYQMIVLDEILGAIKAELVPVQEVLDLIATKPPDLHLVLTGRNAPPELIAAADLVTEMTLVKHPFDQGIVAQRGVEF